MFVGALQAGAVHVAMLIVGRLIAGFSIGLMSTTIPVYCVSAVLQPCRESRLLTPSERGFSRAYPWLSRCDAAVDAGTGCCRRSMFL